MRIIVHTGKGGVGKTSTSAATALRCAELGLKTIVLSTDTAHSLGDSLEAEIGPEPLQLGDNLWAQEVDARYSIEKYWSRVQNYLTRVLTQRGVDEIIAEEVTVLPGLEEGAHLLWINQYMEQGEFDVLIVDAAPTAETLRLLSLPDASRWWFDRIMKLVSGGRFLRPFLKPIIGMELPEEDELKSARQLFDTLSSVSKLLTNPELSSIRLVMTPEKMVVKETQRTFTYLNLYGYATDAIVVNRIIPPEVTDPYFAGWKNLQKDNMELINAAFGQLKRLEAPLFNTDIGGKDALYRLADKLYGDINPAEILTPQSAVHSINHDEKTGDYLLRIPLPFAEKGDLDVYRSSDELTVRVGPYRRNIVLPYTLWKMEIASANFKENGLVIRFVNKEAEPRF